MINFLNKQTGSEITRINLSKRSHITAKKTDIRMEDPPLVQQVSIPARVLERYEFGFWVFEKKTYPNWLKFFFSENF